MSDTAHGARIAIGDESKDTELTPTQCIEKFMRNIKLLTLDMKKRFPRDAMVDRIEKRVALASNVDPLFVMQTVGEYLIKFQKQITAKDEKFFVENSYDAELKNPVKEEKADMSKYLLPKVKESWKTLKQKDKDAYFSVVIHMLELYVTYQIGTAE
ncbi:MAG: hypothetical protein KGL39_10425 [Patescibacteria group bacterium]|nr:hypothetical protein [Patescibacteria group bacterium]